MPLYHFDLADGRLHRDEAGSPCADEGEVRRTALERLPTVARLAIRGDRDSFCATVSVRDEDGNVVYSGTLTYAGGWRRAGR